MYKIIISCLLVVIVVLPFVYPDRSIEGQALVATVPIYPRYASQVQRWHVGKQAEQAPMILNCEVLQMDDDAAEEIVYCDYTSGNLERADWVDGKWQVTVLARSLPAPCHVCYADIDGDGLKDFAVACLGDLFPNDDMVGQIKLLLGQESGSYKEFNVPLRYRRLTDVQIADIDADGDQDLVISEFGDDHGSVVWLEQTERLTFVEHEIVNVSGGIHVPVADYDGDGDLDIAACISQQDELVYMFANDGKGNFKKHIIFDTINYDLGMSGLFKADIDKDGDLDLLLSCGDNLESSFHNPQTYHGAYVLINEGNMKFTSKKIADIPGCYALASGDFDQDGDEDIAAVTMIHDWSQADAASLTLLENQGDMTFKASCVASDPIQMVSCVSGDVDGDGRIDVVTSCMHLFPPFERYGRVDAWSFAP